MNGADERADALFEGLLKEHSLKAKHRRITTRRARMLSVLFLGAAALVALAMFAVLGGE